MIATSIITVLPILVGFLLWDQLPEQMATHFDSFGNPNSYSSKLSAVTTCYLICLGAHIACAVGTCADPRKVNISRKIYRLVLCICPVVSIYCAFATYGYALGYAGFAGGWTWILMGMIFIVMGNYLPKCRQNYTIGIKLPWTLADADTWDYTHRLSGKIWVIAGIFMCLLAFQRRLDPLIVNVGIVCVAIAIPAAASYIYYRKHYSTEK